MASRLQTATAHNSKPTSAQTRAVRIFTCYVFPRWSVQSLSYLSEPDSHTGNDAAVHHFPAERILLEILVDVAVAELGGKHLADLPVGRRQQLVAEIGILPRAHINQPEQAPVLGERDRHMPTRNK